MKPFRIFCCCLVLCCAVISKTSAQQANLFIPPFEKAPERKPEVPLKAKQRIYTEQDLAIAKQNIAQHVEAKQLRDKIIASADKWVNWSDEDLYALLADARVPRGFDLNAHGCPVHGKEVFSKGAYPWKIDPRKPFKVQCPIGDEVYPSNDYKAYYESDFNEALDKSVAYTDDGWGWVAPNGERYWFVAHANHWMWMNEIRPAITNLGRAYLLTGDRRYAHKAAIMLYRLAEVYPSMNHENQSRYGLMSKANNNVYRGKIVNYIWETGLIQDMAETYDAVWDIIDQDIELHTFYKKSGIEIRSHIEANLLEEGIASYFNRKILGNYGMHQMALLYMLLARDHQETDKMIREMVDEPGKDRPHTGVRYALYNQVFRDGLALESPSYNLTWINQLANMSETLRKGGTDLFADKRFKMLLDGPLSIVTTGKFTPDYGDSGSTLGAVSGRLPNAYQIAYAATKDSSYVHWLAGIQQTGGKSFSTFESLFRAPLPFTSPSSDGRAVPIQPSRLYAGYGNAILTNKKDNVALSATYGMHVSHFHWDFLNFELFANGQKMMPDLGYPDAMNTFVSEVYTWSTNTVNHNTVVVNEKRQERNMPGKLHDFAEGSFVRNIDASSPAYVDAHQYRRSLVMVDVEEDQSYVVDFFHVQGGTKHDYILHGPPGNVKAVQGSWGEVQPGTLAGKDVALGTIYDDPVKAAKGYTGGYASYKGSGYQHLFNVQPINHTEPIIEYQHIADKQAQLRIHLQRQDAQSILVADAYDKPRAQTHVLKYVIARRQQSGGNLTSHFVSVLEPYASNPFIKSTRRLAVTGGQGIAVEVVRQGVRDIILHDTLNTVKKLVQYGIETDANTAVLTLDEKQQLTRVYFSDGTYLKYRDKKFSSTPIRGKIESVNVAASEVTLLLDSRQVKPSQAKTMHFQNAYRSTVHPVASIIKLDRSRLRVKVEDQFLVGKLRVEEVFEQSAQTSTNLPFELLYDGTTLLDESYNPVGLIKHIRKGTITWGQQFRQPQKGNDIWISNVGVGDQVKIKNSFSWELGTN